MKRGGSRLVLSDAEVWAGKGFTRLRRKVGASYVPSRLSGLPMKRCVDGRGHAMLFPCHSDTSHDVSESDVRVSMRVSKSRSMNIIRNMTKE